MRLNNHYYKFIIFCSIIISNSSFAQVKCGTLINKQTKKGADYVTISCSDCMSGTFTDERGNFCFQVPEKMDSIVISGLGYKKVVLSKKSFLDNTTFLIDEESITLQNVVVYSKKNKQQIEEIGYYYKRWFQFLDGFSPNSSTKLSVYISNEGQKNCYIQKLLYRLKPETSDMAQSFRLRCTLWKNGKNNLPESELLTSNVVVDVEPSDEKIEKDIAIMQIPLPKEGVWLGIETVGFLDLEGNYQPLSVGRMGEVIYKKSKKIKIEKVKSLTPRFAISKEGKGATAMKVWNYSWTTLKFSDKYNALMFGLQLSVTE